MITIEEAKRIVHGLQLESRDQLSVMLAISPVSAVSVGQVKERCVDAGLRKLASRNISDLLGRTNGLVARTSEGWELQQRGIIRVRELAQKASVNLVITHTSTSLRTHADRLSDPLTKSFVIEAIECFEAEQYRAAVVFSWAGAISKLHEYVYSNKLSEFNQEALRRDSRWRSVKQQDDLGRMKERDFLDVCEAIGVIGKSVKLILQNECLTLRNGCGHPNTMSIAENSVAAHIEKLIANIFARFG